MLRPRYVTLGLVMATAIVLALPAVDDPPYQTLGRLAVQQNGRRKPLDTLAREAVKQIHGAPSVKEWGPLGDTIATWHAVAVLLDWSVRPRYWDDQDFILVPDRPLMRTLLNGTARDLQKLSANQEWLSPNDIERAVVTVDGKTQAFPDWFGAIITKDRAIRSAQSGGRIKGAAPIEPLSVLEAQAMELGERFVRYKAFRDQNGRGLEGLEIEATPLPANATYLAFTREALLAAPRFVLDTFPVENLDQASRESLLATAAHQELDAFQARALEVFAGYIDEVKKKERFLPGTNQGPDQRYLSWLEEKAAWVPIRFLLDLNLNELERAGYQVALVEAFRTAYHELEASQRAHPGHVSQNNAATLISAARALGSSASKSYPTESALALETHYNRAAPFSWAPWPYGIALVLFLISLGFADLRGHGPRAKFGRTLYDAAIVALVIGLAIECYGFALRVMISGWAPVTNMYETVIWVALVTSVLGLVLELISRKTFAALAASGIALLCTGLAATVSEQLLDPSIKSLTPVLRSNYWLTIHVLTIVSSYAAFALAMGLGMVGVGHYLAATYRRPAGYRALAAPLVPGLMFLVLGALVVDPSQTLARPAWLSSDTARYVAWVAAAVGGILTIMSTFALTGEAANRQPIRTLKAGLGGVGLGLVGLIASQASPGSVLWFDGGVLCAGIGASVAVLGLFGMTSPTQATSDRIKPIARFLDRAMQLGVILVATGTILGGTWADYSWGRFWGWDPKEVWALITLLVYLVPLHGRFAGWVSTFGLVLSSVVCFGSVVMAWYGVNFVLGVGLHSYGFSEGGGQGVVLSAMLAVLAVALAAAWRRRLAMESG